MPKQSHGFGAGSGAARQEWKTRKARLNTSNSSESLSRSSRDNAEASPLKKHKQWDKTSMVHLMEAVKSGESRMNQVAKEFGMPLTTLKD